MKKKLFLVIYVLLMGIILFNSSDVSEYGTVLTYVRCGSANGIPSPVPQMTTIAFTLLIVGTPLVLIVFSIIALVKAISSGNSDDIMKVRSKLMKKVIAAAVVFLMAGLGKFALSKVTTNDDDKNSVASCISCFLYNSGCQESDSGNGVNTNIVPSRGQVQDSTSSNSSTVTSSNDASRVSSSNSVPNRTVTNTTSTGLNRLNYNGRNYLLYVPETVDANKPLIIFLHGTGQRGSNIETLASEHSFPYMISNGTKYNTYILMPQLKEGEDWISNYQPRSDIMELIKYVVSQHGIDSKRISIWGFSLGAGQAPYYVKAYPNYFASCVLISTYTVLDNPTYFKTVPTYIFLGDKDAYPTQGKTLANNINAIGGSATTKTYTNQAHAYFSRRVVSDTNLDSNYSTAVEWALSKRRQ